MGFYSIEVLVNDARRDGIAVKPLEVNASEYWSYVDDGGGLRLGFHLIRGLGEACPLRLEAALLSIAFSDMLEFAQCTQLEKEAPENLAMAGVLAVFFDAARIDVGAARAGRT